MKVPARLFVDTSFLIALLRKGDEDHAAATAWAQYVEQNSFRQTTSQAVLWEVLNGLSGPSTRKSAIQMYHGLAADPLVEILSFDPALSDAALTLYAERDDKAWGIVDCLSFVIMRQRGLTADGHFQQAGFDALLLRHPPS
jgi:predicted nucleic acid-binding protein